MFLKLMKILIQNKTHSTAITPVSPTPFSKNNTYGFRHQALKGGFHCNHSTGMLLTLHLL